MKTVTAIAANGKAKMRVPIVAQDGAWSVARGVDLRKGKRKLMRYWVIYHTRSGMAIPYGHLRKKDALTVLRYMAEVPGNWDKTVEEIRADERLVQGAREAWYAAQVEIGTYIQL